MPQMPSIQKYKTHFLNKTLNLAMRTRLLEMIGSCSQETLLSSIAGIKLDVARILEPKQTLHRDIS